LVVKLLINLALSPILNYTYANSLGMEINMNNNVKKTAALAVGALLTAPGCASLSDYTFNGVPMEKLYAESGQVASDAAIDNEEAGFCSKNPWTCAIGAGVAVGAATWAVVEANKKTAPAPVATTPTCAPPSITLPDGTCS